MHTCRARLSILPGPWILKMSCVAMALVVAAFPVAAEDAVESPAESKPVTIGDATIPVDELKLLLKPLTKVQLIVEADAWQAVVQDKATEIARAEIAVKRQNREISKAGEIRDRAEAAKESLETVKEKAATAEKTGDTEAAADAENAAEKASKEMKEVQHAATEAAEAAVRTEAIEKQMSEETREVLDETSKAADRASQAADEVQKSAGEAIAEAGKEVAKAADVRGAAERTRRDADTAIAAAEEVSRLAAGTAAEAVPSASEQAKVMDRTVAAMAGAETAKKKEKVNLLEKVTRLREEQTGLLDRFRTVLDALESKTDDEDSDTLAKLKEYRLYAKGVRGIQVDVEDTTSAWIAIKGWFLSREGGVRWLLNVTKFFGILIAAWIIGKLFSGAIHRGLKRVKGTSRLLESFLVKSVRWVVMAVGLIMALAALEISVGPLLAVVGAAGFVIAFALQDTLSNFASGIMILFFKPFDEGDVVDAGGVAGKVASMNLVSTTVNTFDNKRMVVPNNKIWNDVITNATGVTERRVDMEFGISYGDDIDHASEVLEEIVASHPKVLQEPAPTIRVHTLGDSSVNFIVRPWAKTTDYWDVYWDITRAVKKRFDAVGIGIPFPQRDVHLFFEDAGIKNEVAKLARKSAGEPEDE